VSILCYHAVEDHWSSPLAVTPAAFEEQCEWLVRRRTVVPLGEAVGRLDRRGNLPRGISALTFDDGFASVYEHAFPLVRRHRLPATVFLVSQTLTPQGQEVDWVDTPPQRPLATLTREQVLEMRDDGLDFQSHTWAHKDLTALDHAELVRDLVDSRTLLEDLLTRPVTHLAYPRGRHNERVRQAAHKAGYSYAYALPEGREPFGPYSVPRVGIHRGNDLRVFRIKDEPSYLRVRTSPVYAALRRLRHQRAGTAHR